MNKIGENGEKEGSSKLFQFIRSTLLIQHIAVIFSKDYVIFKEIL